MKKIPATIGILMGLGAIMLSGCAPGNGNATAPETTIMHPSYPKAYESLGQLRKDAKVVLVGSVADVNPGDEADGIPFTNVRLEVTTLIKGPVSDANQIVVQQTGGTADGKVFEVEDDPIMSKGSKALLFLDQGRDGKYFIIGGPAGRIDLTDGTPKKLKGSPMNESLPNSEVALVAQLRALNGE